MPPPEYYDDWDPEEHDRETERLRELDSLHWNRDLRNLRSEVEAERNQERYRAENPGGEYRALREAFVADDPEPPSDDAEGRAEWEWRLNEFVYDRTGQHTRLHRHRMERGLYVERLTERFRNAQEWSDAFWRPLKEAPRPLTPHEPTPWPIGDGISEWRRRRGDEPGLFEADIPSKAFDEPSYAACLDLKAGLRGFRFSLSGEGLHQSQPFRDAAGAVSQGVMLSYETVYLPGRIGMAQVRIRDGVLACQDALGLLDGLAGCEWLTPPAYARLRELLEAVHETAAERYAELRSIYDAYYARAVALLGVAGAPDEPRPSSAELPAYYDDFDPAMHDAEAERLDSVQVDHWDDDLRKLCSDVEHERLEAHQRGRSDGSDWTALREAYAVEHPQPSYDDPLARAEWEWSVIEYALTETGNHHGLHRHRLQRGAYIERRRGWFQEWKDRKEETERIRRESPPRPPKPEARPEWPIGDGVSAIRRRFAEIAAEYEDEEDHPDGALDEPSYDASLDVEAAMFGWWTSLPAEARPLANQLSGPVDRATGDVQGSFKAEYRPGTIGQAQSRMRSGILAVGEAFEVLDALRDEPWMTPAADARLRELLSALRDAAVDRYAELRALYDAYRERALRILGPEGVAGV